MKLSEHFDDPQQPELLRVCRIGRAQGLRGEVTVQAFTDEPERRFATGAELRTRDAKVTYTIAHARTFKNRWILLFEGVHDRDAAESLNGVELYAEAESAEILAAEDAWYPKDLIGLDVRMDGRNRFGAMGGKSIGEVVNVLEGSAQSLLSIRLSESAQGGAAEAANTVLVPFVDQIIPHIDLQEGYLSIDPPGGLIPGFD